jgi:probable phosphoglycerate mutase
VPAHLARIRAVGGDVLVFFSGPFIRVLAARWVGGDRVAPCRTFMLTTASLSAVGYEHSLTRPVIQLWNDDRHVGD